MMLIPTCARKSFRAFRRSERTGAGDQKEAFPVHYMKPLIGARYDKQEVKIWFERSRRISGCETDIDALGRISRQFHQKSGIWNA
jgi:hypothetical protein